MTSAVARRGLQACTFLTHEVAGLESWVAMAQALSLPVAWNVRERQPPALAKRGLAVSSVAVGHHGLVELVYVHGLERFLVNKDQHRPVRLVAVQAGDISSLPQHWAGRWMEGALSKEAEPASPWLRMLPSGLTSALMLNRLGSGLGAQPMIHVNEAPEGCSSDACSYIRDDDVVESRTSEPEHTGTRYNTTLCSLKEVVVGVEGDEPIAQTTHTLRSVAARDAKVLSLWRFPADAPGGSRCSESATPIGLRIIPGAFSAVVLRVPSIEQTVSALEAASDRRITAEIRGQRAGMPGLIAQAAVSAQGLRGFDVRVCERSGHDAFWVESPESSSSQVDDILNPDPESPAARTSLSCQGVVGRQIFAGIKAQLSRLRAI